METAAHIKVKGLVQGVGFRYFVYDLASQLGLKGYVRNLYDGDVDILAEGDRSMLEEFIKRVRIGPRAARVSDLNIEWQSPEYKYSRFEVHD